MQRSGVYLGLVIGLCSMALLSSLPTPPVRVAYAQATAAPTSPPRGDAQRLILATTTSTQDSGLLDFILPTFQKKYNATVDVIAVGTGQALQLGARGDADVVLVHARAQEEAFVKAGDGTIRYDVMYNDFIIIGPGSDPAGIKGLKSATDALRKIAEKKTPFVSRGDESGTHSKEKSIWAKIGTAPKGDWYISAGQGMGAVLTMTQEQNAYTLSDRATFAARKPNGYAPVILVEGDPDLFNPYGVIPVNAAKHPSVNAKLAQTFVEWLISLETQELIASYKIGGQQMFVPDSEAWRKTHAATQAATPPATTSAIMAATMAATAAATK